MIPTISKTTTSRSGNGSSSRRRCTFYQTIASHVVVGLSCIYIGLIIGMSTYMNNHCPQQQKQIDCPACPKQQKPIDCPVCPPPLSIPRPKQWHQYTTHTNRSESTTSASSRSSTQPFPDSLRGMFVDFTTVPRDKFNDDLEIGVPFDDTYSGAEDVLVLYPDSKSLPHGRGSAYGNNVGLNPKKAFENCHSIKVILQDPARKRKTNQCVAIVRE
jgi:hypothetical protein